MAPAQKRPLSPPSSPKLASLAASSPSKTRATSADDIEVAKDFKVPARVWDELSARQRDGVRWLWRLHSERQGGILTDAAGSGKAALIAGYAAGLHHSGLLPARRAPEESGAATGRVASKLGILVLCPALRLPKWHAEFALRCSTLRVQKATLAEDATKIVSAAVRDCGVLVLSYEAFLSVQSQLSACTELLVVDDDSHGQGLRYPHGELTLAAKQFATPHRLLVAHTPVERLVELWSLADFCRPGSVGTLPVFRERLVRPLEAASAGGRHAAARQAVAVGCASALRNMTTGTIFCKAAASVPSSRGLLPESEASSDYLDFVRPLRPLLERGGLRKEDVQAQQAELKSMLREMMRSIQDCAAYSIGLLTWTGKAGIVGRPPPPPKSAEAERLLQERLSGVLSELAVLRARARRRTEARPPLLEQGQCQPSASSTDGASKASVDLAALPPDVRTIAEAVLRAFWDKSAGSQHKLTTGQVLRKLVPKVPTESKELFKGLLQHLCTLSKPTEEGDSGVWSLKRDLWPAGGLDRPRQQEAGAASASPESASLARSR